MKKTSLTTLLSLVIALSACSGPKELSEQQKLLAGLTNEKLCTLLVKEKTSMEDVKKMFGAPYLTKLNNKQETTYFYKVIESKRSEGYVPLISDSKFHNDIKSLNITFERNFVKEYELTQSISDSKYNLSAYNQ